MKNITLEQLVDIARQDPTVDDIELRFDIDAHIYNVRGLQLVAENYGGYFDEHMPYRFGVTGPDFKLDLPVNAWKFDLNRGGHKGIFEPWVATFSIQVHHIYLKFSALLIDGNAPAKPIETSLVSGRSCIGYEARLTPTVDITKPIVTVGVDHNRKIVTIGNK